ncbi:hypothetical protein L6R29_10845 [Myxococcota bacterium]|nr:hypothetical protein [Myxococcota bacterium]
MLSKRAQKRTRTRTLAPSVARRPRAFLSPRISDDAPDHEFEQLPLETREAIVSVLSSVSSDPEAALPRLEALREQFPHVPQIYNATAHAYGAIGDIASQRYWVIKTYELFPHYLFGVCAYGEMLLRREQFEEFEMIFGKKRHLQLLSPDQQNFHTTEAIAFYRMWCRYALQRKDWSLAWEHYEHLCDLDQNHPQVVPLHSIFRREHLHA